MRVLLIALALCAMGAPADAQDVPRFDVEKHCKEVASFGGSYSASMDKSCFDMEQAAYDKVKAGWPDETASARRHCTEIASFGGAGSYSMLESCLTMESKAASDRKRRKFKY
jgi:hypothetical protein